MIRHRRNADLALKRYVSGYCDLLDEAYSGLRALAGMKYILEVNAPTAIYDPETRQPVAVNVYADMLRDTLGSDGTKVVRTPSGFNLRQLERETAVKMSDLDSMIQNIEERVARSYGIPWTVYNGTVTEKSDANNDFMTYAVLPIAKTIQDALTAWMIGESDYIRGDRVHFILAYNRYMDPITHATNIEKLAGIGFTLDEIFRQLGLPEAENEETSTRMVTKNFGNRGDEKESEEQNARKQ